MTYPLKPDTPSGKTIVDDHLIRLDDSLAPTGEELLATVSPESLVTILGVVYVHVKTHDDGDLYLTRFGLPFADILEVENWFEKKWFFQNRERLAGTSAVYRVPTREVNGRRLMLVVKNCRVGEDVPLETHTLMEYINAEFLSPWEEFALVGEMRENSYGPDSLRINTQEPLAIYVPPERMQLWQSGRSRHKINRIRARHPGIDIDILRQYKLVYGWIHGANIIEAAQRFGVPETDLMTTVASMNQKVIDDMEKKGYVVADMKPNHVIISEREITRIAFGSPSQEEMIGRLEQLVAKGRYSIIDYELLLRTPSHEEEFQIRRRHSYLDDVRDRLTATPLPVHLDAEEIMGVPYIHGHVESTGGQLWVVGKNARLFDYFLPERWRTAQNWKLSEHNEVCYTLTKDNIHLVWKTSRVGERVQEDLYGDFSRTARTYGFNSPFEEFALASFLSERGIPTVYTRAIYRTGSTRSKKTTDNRRFKSHRELRARNGEPVLDREHHYITLRGYFNGIDEWVAQQNGALCRPIDLLQALCQNHLSQSDYYALYNDVLNKLAGLGFDGRLLKGNDLLCALMPDGKLMPGENGMPHVRICNLELIHAPAQQ